METVQQAFYSTGLQALRGDRHLVSSLYLTLDRAHDPGQGYVASLKSMIRRCQETGVFDTLDRDQRESLKADWDRMLAWVEGVSGFSQSVAVFACTARGFWQEVALPEPVGNRLGWALRPQVGPLLRLDRMYGYGLMLIVGRRIGRLLDIAGGQITREENWEEEVPQRVKEGGWQNLNEKRIDHHIQDHLRHHLRRAMERLVNAVRERKPGWVILGGSDEARALLEQELGPDVERLLIGRLDMPAEAPVHELLQRALPAQREASVRQVRDTLARLEEGLHQGNGVCGFEATALAAQRTSLHTLFVSSQAVDLEGVICRACNLVSPASAWTEGGRCPHCGSGDGSAVSDAYEELVHQALDQGASVVFVERETATPAWASCEPVAALTRF